MGSSEEMMRFVWELATEFVQRQERVMVFIDGPHIYNALKKLGEKADYHKLARELAGRRKLVRTYMYVTYDPEDMEDYKKAEGFKRALEKGREFVVKILPKRARYFTVNGERKRVWLDEGVKVSMAVDAILLAINDAYDTAIIIGGDPSIAEIIRALKSVGKRVEVATFSEFANEEVAREADGFVNLSHLLERVRLESSEL